MNKQEILELLKSVHYPGFSRDIVSFGMVHNIEMAGDGVLVELQIVTQKADKKQAVVDAVTKALTDTQAFKNVEVKIVETGNVAKAKVQGEIKTSPLEKIKNIVAVASGKGGVGKSTVAANIAAALVQKQFKVGLLDLDIYGPSLPIILGFNENPKMTQDKKLIPLDRYGMKVMSFGFISGNETPTIWRGPLVSRMTEQFFQDVIWGELDYLILDLPPGTGDIQLTLTQKLRLSGAVIVTTPQDIALSDVRKGADMFKKVQTPVLGVIENMSGLILKGRIKGASQGLWLDGIGDVELDPQGHFTFQLDIFKKGGGVQESSRLGVPLLGEIPISRELMEATDKGKPLVLSAPDSPVSKIYYQISEKIISLLGS